MLYYQLNNASTKEVREVNMNAAQLLNKNHSTNIDLFAELGHHFGARGVLHNLGSWLAPEKKIMFKSAHNTDDRNTSTYQPGDTGIVIRGPMTQYTKHGDQY